MKDKKFKKILRKMIKRYPNKKIGFHCCVALAYADGYNKSKVIT